MSLLENIIFYGIGTVTIIGIIYYLIIQLIQQYHNEIQKLQQEIEPVNEPTINL